MSSIIKRFVAGAVCPRCGEMDRLRVWRDELREYRECIDCGYEDAMRLDGAREPAELKTRVNQSAVTINKTTNKELANDEPEVIRFLNHKNNKDIKK